MLGLGRSPGGGHGSHSSNIACRIPWTEEPNGLQSSPSTKSVCQNRRNFLFSKWKEKFQVQSDYYCYHSVAQLCPALCDPMDCSMPGFPVLHCLLQFAQTHVLSSRRCHPTFLSSVAPFCSFPQSFPERLRFFFLHESALHSRWPKYWNDYRE